MACLSADRVVRVFYFFLVSPDIKSNIMKKRLGHLTGLNPVGQCLIKE
jgi:hypothetical protein